MSSTTIAYTPRPDATQETELSVLAQVYRFILESRKADEPAPEPIGRDGTTVEGDSADMGLAGRSVGA